MAKAKELISEKKFEKLTRSIEWSNRELERPRRERVEHVMQFVGSHHSSGGSSVPVPVNSLKMAVDIYGRSLAPQAPRVLVTSPREDVAADALSLELAVNMVPNEIGLGATLRRWVTEALFSIGVLKVGLHGVGQAMGHEYGTTFVDVVTMDDYLIDMSAKTDSQVQYEGNDYWMRMDKLKKQDWTHKKNYSDADADEYTVTGEHGEERAEGVTTGGSADVYSERKWLRDVYLHQENLMITYSVKDKKIYNVVEWDGPKGGPYIRLGFSDVPGGLLPLAPVGIWRDLHDLGNALFRKLGDQADAEKTVLGFPTDDDGVKAFQGARDGDGIVSGNTKPEKLTAGGVNPTTLAFYLKAKDLASYFAGNLDALGGLGALSETATQDKLMSESASSQLRDMSVRTSDAMRILFGMLAFYEWNDPIRSRTLQKQIPDTDITVPVKWNADSRQGDFAKFQINIDIYSLQDESPQTKLQKLTMIVERYIVPFLQLIQAGGGTFDIQRLLQLVARYTNTPEIMELVVFSEQPPAAQSLGQQAPGGAPAQQRPPQQPGPPKGGGDAEMMQMLLAQGEGAQPSQ